MKKIFFILSLVCLTLVSCSDEQSEPKLSNPIADNSTTAISEETAVSIAASAIEGLGKTRSDISVPEVQYVLRSEKTRSSQLPDTLAYVFNYPDNGGFAVISTDSRVEPLLAYSDEGRFDCESDFVKENILRPIEGYFEAYCVSTRLGIGGDNSGDFNFGYDVIESVSPMLLMKINQVAPWNKVVEANKGTGYVAGCVPVALGYIMTHCKSSLTLRGRTYRCDDIVKAIASYQGVPGLGLSRYSYDTAVTEMAQLLWDIGQEIGATYAYNAKEDRYYTFIYSDRLPSVVSWMNSLGYTSPKSGFENGFNVETIVEYIKGGNLVSLSGAPDNNPSNGHFWLTDGYQKRQIKMTVTLPFPPAPSTYLHFQWGEVDELDGYYYGEVYTQYGQDYRVNKYYPFTILI